MARWKARVDFLLSVIELLFLSLTVEALQGKMCQDSLLSGGGTSLGAKISGRKGRPWGIFLASTKLDTFCYLTVQTVPCYVPSFWHNTGVWRTDGQMDGQTDRQTDGIAVASTPFAMRRAVKIGSVCPSVCATVSGSINPLPSEGLRFCDWYIRCQWSLACR